MGLASALAVVTLSLAVTGRLGLYVNPDSAWFAVGMAVVLLVGAVASFTLPLGAEADHGHDHGDSPVAHAHEERSDADPSALPSSSHARHAQHATEHALRPTVGFGTVATIVGGVAASGVVVLTLVLPPATLSAELAMSRDVGAPSLFGGTDVVALATTGDTASFGVGEWATVFATATNPDAFDGDPVTLTGFVTPGDGDFQLTRLVITHCVIDAQPASIPVVGAQTSGETGQWVTVTGTVRSSSDGRLVIDAASVESIDEPQDPYEY